MLEKKKKSLEQKISNPSREERTRRLMQKGALLEKYLDDEISLKQTDYLLKLLEVFINKNYVERQIENLFE